MSKREPSPRQEVPSSDITTALEQINKYLDKEVKEGAHGQEILEMEAEKREHYDAIAQITAFLNIVALYAHHIPERESYYQEQVERISSQVKKAFTPDVAIIGIDQARALLEELKNEVEKKERHSSKR